MRDFIRELRRRKVFTVGAAYVVIAWLLLQVAAASLIAPRRRPEQC